MAEKDVVTIMILYVDLKCSCCYKKVKKLLCKFPQIRDQVFDEDKNKVMITVVCCNPEKLRDKLCCKGGKAIESIEIVEKSLPRIPKQHEKPQKPKESEKPKQPSSPTPAAVVSKPSQPQLKPVKKPDLHQPFCPPVSVCCQECSEGRGGGPCHYGYGRHIPSSPCPCYNPKKPDPPAVTPPVVSKPLQPPPEPVKKPDPVPQHQPDPIHQPFCPPVSVCCQECYEGRGGGPCHCPPVSVCCQECNKGRGGGPCHCPPVSVCCQECNKGRGGGPCQCPPVSVCCQECSEGHGGGPCHCDYGRHIPPSPGPCCDPNYGYQYRPCYVTRCDCFSEENPQGCSTM